MSVALNDGPRSFDPTSDINPATVEKFLRLNGWVQESIRDGISSIWANRADDASILLPYNTAYRDYNRRLDEALRVIAEVQRVPYGEALGLEIAGAISDVLLVRADQTTLDSSIPLREAQNLINGVQKLMLAAACSAVRPRPTLIGRRPDVAKEFVADDVRMGHTLRGSFVLTIYARHTDLRTEEIAPSEDSVAELQAASRDVNLGAPELTSSFTRRVMTTLATGLNATSELLAPDSSLDLATAVELGVSDELLSSVDLMSKYEGLRALDLSFRWSPAQLYREPNVPSRVIVPRADPEHIKQIKMSLREQPVIEHDSVVGQVVRLERAEGHEDGVVVVDGYLGRTRRRVRISLSGDAYQTAIHAHENRVPVIVEGNVSLEGRTWWLRGPVTLHRALENRD